MKILITGVNGFIGQHIADNLTNDQTNMVWGIGHQNIAKNSFICYNRMDIADDKLPEKMLKITPEIDIIIHAAAQLSGTDSQLCSSNIIGTKNLVDYAMKANCKQMIYTSSSTVIGKPITIPIDETHSILPEYFYQLSKYTGELICLAPQNKFISTVLRIPSPIGCGMNKKTIIPIFLKQAKANLPLQLTGTGQRIQNYIDIQDIFEAVVCSMNHPYHGVLNIANSQSISNMELAQLCVKITNSQSTIIFSDQPDPFDDYCWTFDIQKAQDKICFSPNCSLETSLAKISRTL